MKPSFALNFTDDSVALLHRTKRGWLEVGRSGYDTPDLAEAMSYMRATALGLAPQGVTTKLVIPASQVRYFDIEAPGPSDADRNSQIAAALDGRTAYAVDDLAFDWSGTGPTVSVAVVARETLAEAEAFALAHRFAPLSFVALPEDGTFGGEPWFGLTAHATGALSGGETVERDAETITILSRALPRSAAPATPQIDPPAPAAPVIDPTPEPEPTPDPAPEPDPVVEPDPIPDPAPRPLPDPVIDPEPRPEPLPIPEPVPATVPEPAPELPDPEPVQIPQPDVTPDPGPDLPPPAEMPAFDPVADPVTMTAAPPAPALDLATDPGSDPDEAPIALDVEEGDVSLAAWPALQPRARPQVMPTNVTENSLPPDEDTPATTGAFSSRRVPSLADTPAAGTSAAGSASAGPALATATATAAQNLARRLGAASRSALASVSSATPTTTPPRPPKFGFPEQAEPPPPRRPDLLPARQPDRQPTPPIAKANFPDPGTSPHPAATTADPASLLHPAIAPARTLASQRGPRSLTAPVKGKPRYLGLILTGLLLVALALAAAVSSYYSASTTTADPVALASAPNAEPAAAVPDPAAPSIDDEMLADGQDPEALADPAGGDITTADLGVSATAQPTPQPAPEPVATTTGDAPALQASTAGNDEIYLSATDAAPPSLDAAALPVPAARGDPAPDAPLPPPAFGTVYKFDANGLIVPTPQGITTPEGVLLVAGKPPVVPPARPADLAPPETPPASATPASPTPTANPDDQTQLSPADPALRGKRPAARPAQLAATAVSQTGPELGPESGPPEDPSLAPPADSRLAGVRPLPRPATITAAPTQTPSTLALVTPDGAISPLGGLSLSPRPVARPSAIASAVEAAVAAAAIQPEPATEPAPQPAILDDGNVTPETEQEPQLASAAPSIPTQANVAKEATDKNVLNLGKINLIGVYGSQSNRYALVRQPNGRIVKVGVGDRIDGGRVAAVTETELRYEKRGQMLVLAMPRG